MMKLILWAAGILLLGLVLAACGGGKSDEEAVEDLARQLTSAIEEQNQAKIAGLFSKDCGDMEEDIRSDFEELQAFGIDIEIDVTGVDIRNLDGDSAEVLPRGTMSFGGEKGPLEEGREYIGVVKEDGEWKIADCDFFE
jgi:hypothetical protein